MSRPRGPRPLPKGDSLFTPGATPARQALEDRAAAPLLWLHQLPGWVLPVLAAVLLITGLAVRGPGGAAAFAGLALVLAWLAALSWPRLDSRGRLLRAVALAVVACAAVIQAIR